jgi:hypothetical protein
MRSRLVRTGSAVAVAIAVAALCAGAAAAGRRILHDRKGDTKKGQPDIEQVTTVSSASAVTWTIEAYNTFSKRTAPCVGISLSASTHPQGDNLEICGDGGLQDFMHGGGTVGLAWVARPNRHEIVYRVNRSFFGGAATISWEVQVRDQPACSAGLCDQAPNGPGQHIVQRL